MRQLRTFVLLGLCAASSLAQAACVDNVVMVHDNAAYPQHWDNTYNLLLRQGYAPAQLFRPNWGSKTDASANAHIDPSLATVKTALNGAVSGSCTGRIDVLAHGMGVTLAMKAIADLGIAARVDAFVGIGGAPRGLPSCGTYPNQGVSPACGPAGLSLNSPLVQALSAHDARFGARMYSIKSLMDEVACATGTCMLNGMHVSSLDGESATQDFPYGHFGLLFNTALQQYNFIK